MNKAFDLCYILVIVVLLSCQSQSDKRLLDEKVQADSTASSNKRLAVRTLAALDKNDFDELNKCLADSFRFEGPGVKVPLSRQDFYTSVKEHFTAFPDWHHRIDEMLMVNDKVFIQVTRTGTQMGEFIGLKPSNIKITNSACYLMTIENNKVLRWWALEDRWGVVKALGIEIKRPTTTNGSVKK